LVIERPAELLCRCKDAREHFAVCFSGLGIKVLKHSAHSGRFQRGHGAVSLLVRGLTSPRAVTDLPWRDLDRKSRVALNERLAPGHSNAVSRRLCDKSAIPGSHLGHKRRTQDEQIASASVGRLSISSAASSISLAAVSSVSISPPIACGSEANLGPNFLGPLVHYQSGIPQFNKIDHD
jgi:hypothetical protein